MTVTDSDRFAIAMAKLSQARSAVYEATRIIEHLFEADRGNPVMEVLPDHTISKCGPRFGDPVDGLYPGQQPEFTVAYEEPEDITECVE